MGGKRTLAVSLARFRDEGIPASNKDGASLRIGPSPQPRVK
jgi:hypothetical protein